MLIIFLIEIFTPQLSVFEGIGKSQRDRIWDVVGLFETPGIFYVK